MTDGVSQAQFYDAMRALSAEIQDSHRRQREHLDAQSLHILRVFEEHKVDDLALGNRVLTIEIERAGEQKQLTKRGAWAGMIAAVGLTALIEGIKHFVAGWK